MDKIEKLKLIEGAYPAEDAREILMSVFLSKMSFHERKHFSSIERFGKEDSYSLKRIAELKKAVHVLNSLVAEAEEKNQKLLISSDINVSFSKD
jgi:hypothetical protein